MTVVDKALPLLMPPTANRCHVSCSTAILYHWGIGKCNLEFTPLEFHQKMVKMSINNFILMCLHFKDGKSYLLFQILKKQVQNYLRYSIEYLYHN